MVDFEGFLIERNDKLEQTAHELLWHMTHPDREAPETDEDYKLYDMAQIGPLLDMAEEILQDAGHAVCHPYYGESETPCYLEGDCGFSPCPMCEFKSNGGKQNEQRKTAAHTVRQAAASGFHRGARRDSRKRPDLLDIQSR